MSTPDDKNDYQRLKAELRRLKRSEAPWYFESALHQRLHGRRRGRARLRPIEPWPIIALTLITLCILGAAAYIVMVNTNLFPRGAMPAQTVPPALDSLRTGPRPDSVAALRTPARSIGGNRSTTSRVTRRVASDSLRHSVPPSDSASTGSPTGGDARIREKKTEMQSVSEDSLRAHPDSARHLLPGPPSR